MHLSTFLCFVLLGGTALTAQRRLASISGRVQDITGAVIVGVQTELWSQDDEGQRLGITRTDALGKFTFASLAEGDYVLRLTGPGFQSLTVKSVHVADRADSTLPALELSAGEIASCGGRAVLEYLRLTPGDKGSLGGTVRVDLGPLVGNGPPVKDADVVLLCRDNTPCRTTKTDEQGRFSFAAGGHVIRASRPGFYPETLPGYIARDGRELVYSPLYIERCFSSDCDPAKRPKKPLTLCE